MENFSYLALLLCPIMMIGLFYLLMRGQNNNDQKENKTEELRNNMEKIMKQNEQLIDEIERLKRTR